MARPEPSPGTTRISLLLRLKQRPSDPEAWARFVYTYGPLVVHWCKAYGLQEADAADLAQEALLRFWRTAERLEYDRTRRLRGYLRQLVTRTCYDWHQKNQRQPRGSGESAVLTLLDQVPAREDLITRLESMFDHEVLQRAMRRVQRRVKPTTWQAFQLQAINGLSGKQTAEILSMKVGTVMAARCDVQELIQQTVRRIERTHGGSDAHN